jgi:hypothetical protein
MIDQAIPAGRCGAGIGVLVMVVIKKILGVQITKRIDCCAFRGKRSATEASWPAWRK